MGRIKYVIYGAGIRGRGLYEYLGEENVAAFIDSDSEKIGKTFCGKPIVGIEDYKERYAQCFIIISVFFDRMSIICRLMEKEVFQFTCMSYMPSEFRSVNLTGCNVGDSNSYCNNIYRSFEECYKNFKQHGKKYVLYGLNAFSLMLYEYLCTDSEICIVPEKKDDKIVCWLQREHPEVKLAEMGKVDRTAQILVTTASIALENINLFEKNMLVDMLDYSDNLPIYYHKELEQFKNMFWDRKRCFITATGPSMNEQDLETLRIHDEFCIGMNSMCLYDGRWKPNVFVVADTGVWMRHKKDILSYDADWIFLPDFFKISEYRQDNVYQFHLSLRNLPEDASAIMFSEDICQKIVANHTVAYECVQMAVYFGFKEIYLLGTDCSYVSGSRHNHFVPDQDKDIIDYKGYLDESIDMLIACWRVAKKYADSHGIKIYNATRGGKLEVFERVDFDSLF